MVLGSHWSSPLLRETTYTSYTYNYLLPRQFLLRHTIKFGNEKHPGSQFAKWLPIPPYVVAIQGQYFLCKRGRTRNGSGFSLFLFSSVEKQSAMLHLQICHFAEDKISCTIPTVQAIPWYDTYLYFCLYFPSPILTKIGRGKFNQVRSKSLLRKVATNRVRTISL